MIVLNLVCGGGHHFEAWFASGDAFEAQSAEGLVACPYCNDTAIARLPSAPRVKRTQPHSPGVPESGEQMREAIGKLAQEAEDVGTRFPEEARRIHYQEAPERTIRGQASVADTLELLEEGIPVLPLPSPGKKSSH